MPTKDEKLQTWRDNFHTDDIDDFLFCTEKDNEIERTDMPERLQLKLAGRFNPSSDDLKDEATWIFNEMLDSFDFTKENVQQSKKVSTINKIQAVLRMFRKDKKDVPFIANYAMHELAPDIEPKHVWRIFNLDMEHGKFVALKRQVEDFLKNVQTLQSDSVLKAELEAYIQHVYYTKRHRELRNYEPLIDFYKSYYQSDLEKLVSSKGPEKKLPGQRRHFVSQSRAQKIDQFARRFVLRPLQFLENVDEDRIVHRPEPPENLKFRDVLYEYVPPEADGEVDKKKAEHFLQDTLLYVAVELWCQPKLRKLFKDHIRENGVLVTQPTEKGTKELDLLHSSYRVKRINKRL